MSIPATLYAGDSASWSVSLPDYPASGGWTLSYALVSPSVRIAFPSTADGDAHTVNVAAATTAAWAAGEYHWQSYVTHTDGRRATVGAGVTTVRPNFAAQESGLDARSHCKKVLDAIEATILGKATKGQLSIEVSGIRLEQYKIPDLLKLRDRYLVSYRNEQTVERLANGGAPRGRIMVRF